jgi:hypothetical protein
MHVDHSYWHGCQDSIIGPATRQRHTVAYIINMRQATNKVPSEWPWHKSMAVERRFGLNAQNLCTHSALFRWANHYKAQRFLSSPHIILDGALEFSGACYGHAAYSAIVGYHNR